MDLQDATDRSTDDDATSESSGLRPWARSRHYARIALEGQTRPAPSVGSPTLVWQLGVWRREGRILEAVTPPKTGPTPKGGDWAGDASVANQLNARRKRYDAETKAFYTQINGLLADLQLKGSVRAANAPQDPTERARFVETTLAQFAIDRIDLEGRDAAVRDEIHRFVAPRPASETFTLWWMPETETGALNAPCAEPPVGALRVLVQAQAYADHATIAFYIDGEARFGEQRVLTPDDGVGHGGRRKTIAEHLTAIRDVSHDQIRRRVVDDGALPEDLRDDVGRLTGSSSDALDRAAHFFYREIWDDFAKSFGLHERFADEASEHGVVFSSHRGLMMAVRGLTTEADAARTDTVAHLAQENCETDVLADRKDTPNAAADPEQTWASATLGPVNLFDQDANEPATVLKATIPFLRRISPGADRHAWVGCGILDGRALLISPLGAQATPAIDDAPSLSYPQNAFDTGSAEHIPFLILTKGEPHRDQIGRLLERFLALESLRFVALRNINIIRNAYVHLRLLTHALDTLLGKWNKERDAIWEKFKPDEISQNEKTKILEIGDGKSALDQYYEHITVLNERFEKELIRIGAEFDRISPLGVSRLDVSLQRSAYYAAEFNRMRDSLEIVNVQGWIHYRQFAQRSVQPTLDLVDATARRLRDARDRLQSLTDTVQASALIAQSQATRANTATIKRIARFFRWRSGLFLSLIFAIGLALAQAFTWAGGILYQEYACRLNPAGVGVFELLLSTCEPDAASQAVPPAEPDDV